MEERENSGGTFDGAYNKLTSQEDLNADDHPLYSNQEKRQGKSEVNECVCMSTIFCLWIICSLILAPAPKIVQEMYYCASMSFLLSY